jgi:dienelactone hydrolase
VGRGDNSGILAMKTSARRGTRKHWRFASYLNVAILPIAMALAPASFATAHQNNSVTFTRSVVTAPSRVATVVATPHRPAVVTGRVAVGVQRCTFIDDTRAVLDYSTATPTIRSNHRTLLTEIRYPIQATGAGPNETTGAAPLERRGGYPMIIFAHGYDVTPDTYAALLDDWARAGYVVVAPFFPDEKFSAVSAQHNANTEGDLANEPGDLAFVTKEITRASATPTRGCPVVRGLVNASQIALAGQSDGGNAVAMLAYDHSKDPQGIPYTDLHTGIHYQAVMILSGAEAVGQTYAAEEQNPSLLMIQSVDDQCNLIGDALKLYRDVEQPNKWLLELLTAHHLPPYNGTDKAAFRIVVATSVRFLEASLHVAQPSRSLVAYGNQYPSVARMYDDQEGPSLKNVPVLDRECGLT